MFFVVWIVLACLVARLFSSRGHSFMGGLLLSLVFSPLIGLIVGLLMSPRATQEP
jgi:hypothetical protein